MDEPTHARRVGSSGGCRSPARDRATTAANAPPRPEATVTDTPAPGAISAECHTSQHTQGHTAGSRQPSERTPRAKPCPQSRQVRDAATQQTLPAEQTSTSAASPNLAQLYSRQVRGGTSHQTMPNMFADKYVAWKRTDPDRSQEPCGRQQTMPADKYELRQQTLPADKYELRLWRRPTQSR